MGHRYPKETVLKALAMLQRSADQNGGVPNLKAVSRETNHNRGTLRNWWKSHIKAGVTDTANTPPSRSLRLVTTGETAPPATAGAGIYGLDEIAFIEQQAAEAADLYERAKEDRSYVAAGKIFDRMTELYHQLKAARQTAADAAGLDEAAFVERLEDEVRGIPDPHLEIYVREYLERHRLQLVAASGDT